MLKRMPSHVGDTTCPACVVAGEYIFLAHHSGGEGGDDVVRQMRAAFENMQKTLASVGATLDDMVQINLYLKNIEDFRGGARDVFYEYFKNGFPARMTATTVFIDDSCLCQMDGVAYKPRK
jgi:2-iminobutanoate/2-iminopropanoate deaminase